MFDADRDKNSEALHDRSDASTRGGLNWRRLAFPGYKNGKIPGFHTPRYCPEVIVKLEEVFEHYIKVVVGAINDKGVLMLDRKTLFKPGLSEYEIDCLFNKACMNIEESLFSKGRDSWRITSNPIDGLRCQFFVSTNGKIKSFFPIDS